MTGRMYDERLGRWHFWLTFVSFNATFFPMHYVGLRGMPRRVSDYAEVFGDMNLFISIASFVLGASFVLFVYNIVTSWARAGRGRGPVARPQLEWQVSSPPPIFNFDEIPQVVGGPYEYGVPGARHAIMRPAHDAREAEEGAGVSDEGDARTASSWRTRRSSARCSSRPCAAVPSEGRSAWPWSPHHAAAHRLRRLPRLEAGSRGAQAGAVSRRRTRPGSPRTVSVFDDDALAAVKDILAPRRSTRSSSPRIPRARRAGSGATSSRRSARPRASGQSSTWCRT